MASFQKGDTLDTMKMKRVKFPLPEIGDGKYLTVRALSAPEVDEHIATGADGIEKKVSGYKLISLVAVTDEGALIFDSEDDARKNLQVSAESVQSLVKKILDISGLSPEKDRAKN